LMISTCIFFALSIALLIALVSTVNNAYAVHMGSAEHTGSTHGGRAFTLGDNANASAGVIVNGAEISAESHDPHNLPGEARDLQPQTTASSPQQQIYALLNSGPLAMFSQYPILIVALCLAPIFSSVLFLLLVTSPYWFVWWYVTTPFVACSILALEVGVVMLYWSKILSQHVFTRVLQTSRRIFNSLLSTSRTVLAFIKQKITIIVQEYQARQKSRIQQRQQPFGYQFVQSNRQPQQQRPQSPTTDEDASNGFSSAVSSSSQSSRRSSHGGGSVEGESVSSTAQVSDPMHGADEVKSGRAAGKTKEKNKKKN